VQCNTDTGEFSNLPQAYIVQALFVPLCHSQGDSYPNLFISLSKSSAIAHKVFDMGILPTMLT